ncbi:MAG: AAA family ATPase [Microthrixaceae bacterium]
MQQTAPEAEVDAVDRGLEVRLRAPATPEALGVSMAVLEDIVLRQVVTDVRTDTTDIARKVHVNPGVIDTLSASMRDRNLIEYQGMQGRAYVVSATDLGKANATQRSAECRYTGPIPVSLAFYHEVVRAQHPNRSLNRASLERAFGDLVIEAELLDELGPAIHGDGAMFLYGPPGTGKTSVAERIVRTHDDFVLIPYCIEVEGQIISVFDPTLHEPIAEQPEGLDPRWVACLRPAVVTGGELHAGMLDLQLEADSGVYLAPLQLKANNGVFVIDDFGRQSASPEELLNRWIVPLDRGIDYLTLMGRKFEVPFDLKVVLSTNMQPAKLGDDAFFRRIHSKVFVGACSDPEFDEILRRVTEAMGIEVADGAAEHLRHFARSQGDGELRAYLPGTVCKLARSISAYLEEAPVLTAEMIDRVMSLYFTRDF